MKVIQVNLETDSAIEARRLRDIKTAIPVYFVACTRELRDISAACGGTENPAEAGPVVVSHLMLHCLPSTTQVPLFLLRMYPLPVLHRT